MAALHITWIASAIIAVNVHALLSVLANPRPWPQEYHQIGGELARLRIAITPAVVGRLFLASRLLCNRSPMHRTAAFQVCATPNACPSCTAAIDQGLKASIRRYAAFMQQATAGYTQEPTLAMALAAAVADGGLHMVAPLPEAPHRLAAAQVIHDWSNDCFIDL